MAIIKVMDEPMVPSTKQVHTALAARVQLLGFQVTIISFAIDLELEQQYWEDAITAIGT
jgi:hypothetical protein